MATGYPRVQVSEEQRAVLETVFAVFMRIGDWPTHLFLERELDNHGIELNDCLETMGPSLFAPDNRARGGSVFYQEGEKLSLRIRGLSICRGSEPQQAAFMAALRWAVRARQALQVPPNEPVQAEWPLSDATAAMEAELGRSVALNEIKLVFDLMQREPDLPNHGGIWEDISTWKIHVPREIRRFRQLVTLDEYLELTEPRARSVPVPPLQPWPSQSEQPDHPLFGSIEREETFECFVVMPFCEPFEQIYRDVIRPVCQELDISCGHVGEIFGPGRIINDVYALIAQSRVVIAELTGRNPNVFYELGIAHAQAKPVIQLSQEMDDVPFDVRDLRTIVYDWDGTSVAANALCEKLRSNLVAALR